MWRRRMAVAAREGAGAAGTPAGSQAVEADRQAGGDDALLSSVRVFLALRCLLRGGSAEWAEGGGVPGGEGVGLGGHPPFLMAATVLASNPPLKVSDLPLTGKISWLRQAGKRPAVRRILERLLTRSFWIRRPPGPPDRAGSHGAKALSRDQR